MIRQAISCDVCGSQKRQTNHWFVAYEQARELRVSGWDSPHLMCPGTKHLCGETCVHKLVSEFLAGSAQVLTQQTSDWSDAQPAASSTMDINITGEAESSSRLLKPPAPTLPRSGHYSARASERLPRWQTQRCGRNLQNTQSGIHRAVEAKQLPVQPCPLHPRVEAP